MAPRARNRTFEDQRYYRESQRYFLHVRDGLSADLEVGDRVEFQHGNHLGKVIEIRKTHVRTQYLIRLFNGTERWANRDMVAYMPTQKRILKRAERLRRLWTEQDREVRARWAVNPVVDIVTYCGLETFTVGET